MKPEELETETGQRSEGRPPACVGLCKDLAFTMSEMGAFGRVLAKKMVSLAVELRLNCKRGPRLKQED